MATPLVSVAIPAYKAKYLRQAIDSVLNQDYYNIELIIVNDKSPEDIDSIVRSYDDFRIRYYVNEKNLGREDLVTNWDKCLSYANGDFFCLLCDDDLYEPSFISKMLSLAEQYEDCGVFRARCQKIDKTGAIYDIFPSCPSRENSYDYLYHVFRRVRHQSISEFLYRTEHIRKYGGYVHFPLAWHADYFSVIALGKEGGIASTNEILVTFRMSEENISSQARKYGVEMAKANFMAFKSAEVYVNDADEPLKHLLISYREKWKRGWDGWLISV